MRTTDGEYDVIVVGSGPGGATVARELSQRGKRVLVLEWGDNDPITGTAVQFFTKAGIPGKGLMITDGLLGMVRGITTGGSSVFYYGTAFPPPVDMLNTFGVDISREIDEIRAELPTAPLAPHLIGPMATRLMQSARELGFPWNPMPKFVFQERCQPNCWRCNYGCPFGAKWNARMFIHQAIDHGAELVTGARVQRVLTEGNHVAGVVFRRKGEERSVRAPVVVLGAGGVGTPMILRASGIAAAGYDWFYDPLITVMGDAADIEGGREFPMATGMHVEEDGYVMTDMTVPFSLHAVFNAEVFKFKKIPAHARTLTIMIKVKDELGGRLTKNGHVRKGLTRADKEKFAHGYARAARILKNAGAKDVWKSWYVAAHPGGTVKIGHLLDADLQTTTANLYACDCSVIPDAWGLPPTFTLVALGKRLAKHIVGASVAPDPVPATAEITAESAETAN